jgi:hypothetical protein
MRYEAIYSGLSVKPTLSAAVYNWLFHNQCTFAECTRIKSIEGRSLADIKEIYDWLKPIWRCRQGVSL